MQRIWGGGFVLAAAVAYVLSASATLSQQKPTAPKAQSQQLAIPDAYKLNMMIRSSIIALNHANKTGNYTVLQDLGAPSFRASNNTVRLGQIFAQLRQRNLDLSPILFFQPKLLRQPQISNNGILRLTGYFETKPERVNFDLYFQNVKDDWRIFGIGVTTSRPAVTAAIPRQPQPNAGGQQPARSASAGAKPSADSSSGPGKPAAQRQEEKPASRALAAPPPERKPDIPRQAATASAAETADDDVQNRTVNNAVRTDLSDADTRQSADTPSFDAAIETTAEATGAAPEEQPEDGQGFWNSFNPFFRN